MARKIVTLYVDDVSIRLLVADGKGVGKWTYSALEPGLVQGGVVTDEEAVASRLKLLFEEKQIREKRVIVGLSGLHSLTLVINLPELPKSLLAEAVMRETARVLPVPLEQLYVTWQTLPPVEEKRIRAFAIAIPRNTADSLLRTVRQAGLTPYLMEIKPLALVRLVTERTAIILDVQQTEFDIVILANGVPQPIRTISIPSEGLSWEEKLPMFRDDLVRTVEFYNSKNPEHQLGTETPLYISGELADEPDISRALSKELGRPLEVLSLQAERPAGLSINRYGVNLGLAAKMLPPKGQWPSLVADMDSLPAAYQPKTFSPQRVLALTGIGLAVGMVIAQIVLVRINATAIDAAETRLETVSRIIEQRKLQRRELSVTLVQAEAYRDTFAAAVEALGKKRTAFNDTLEVAAATLPGSVSVSSIVHSGSRITVEMQSMTEAPVLDYARLLETSGHFSSVSVINMRRDADGTLSFVVALETEE